MLISTSLSPSPSPSVSELMQVLAVFLWGLESWTGKPMAQIVGLGSKQHKRVEHDDPSCTATRHDQHPIQRLSAPSFRRFDSTLTGSVGKFDQSMVVQDVDEDDDGGESTTLTSSLAQASASATRADLLHEFDSKQAAFRELWLRLASSHT